MDVTVVYYDQYCNLCLWLKKAFHRVKRESVAIEWRHYEDAPACGIHETTCGDSMSIQTGEGKIYRGYYAVRELTRYTWLFPLRPFLYLPGMDWAGEKIYQAVARNRYHLFGKSNE